MAGYIVKITLENTHPPVWRRVIVPEDITFASLHEVIQRAFGWEDDHLHDFRTNDNSVCIAPEEDGYADFQFDEQKTRVNEFLENFKWLRYTYDFGDDWRHKIVLEKKDEEYSKPYAQIIKYKGNNFIEDFDWDENEASQCEGEYGRQPFEMEEVNRMLEKMACRFSQEAPVEQFGNDMAMEDVAGWKDMLQKTEPYFQEMMRLIDLKQKMGQIKQDQGLADGEYARISEMSEKIVRIRQYFDERDDMALSWNLAAQSSHVLRNLSKLNRKETSDYCRYWCISVDPKAKKATMAEAFWEALLKQPENLCYVFTVNDLKELMNLYVSRKLSQPRSKTQVDLWVKAITLGLVDAEFKEDSTGRRIELVLSDEAVELFSNLKKTAWKRTVKQIEFAADKVQMLLGVYGCIRLDFLKDRLSEWWQIDFKENDFEKLVYCHFNFLCIARTFTSGIGGVRYLADRALDIENIMTSYYAYASDVEEYPFTLADVKKMQKGFHLLYPEWDELEMWLDHIAGIHDKKARDQITREVMREVLSGLTATEIIFSLEDFAAHSKICAGYFLWDAIMTCCLRTGLPMLNGYSRIKLAEKKKLSAYSYHLLDTAELSAKVKYDTPIYKMPLEIQKGLYEALEIEKTDNAIREMERILQEVLPKNYQIRFMIISTYLERGEPEKAEPLIRALHREIGNTDSYLNMLQSQITAIKSSYEEHWIDAAWDGDAWYEEDMPQTPYRRTEKKIGRNDPCPCGSGKKYKKCCGRKG